MSGRRLFKTKLCLLYQRGRCSRPNCNFAHGHAELRHAGGSFNGRREFRGGDLRDKLDKRHSPHRRYSPAREGRGHHPFQNERQISYDEGSSLSRSPVRRSDRKRRKNQHVDGNSNAPDDLRASMSPEVRRREEQSPSHSANEELWEQLHQIQLDIKELDNHKSQLVISLSEKVDEERKLNVRISDLESQLMKEQDNFKWVTARLKQFIEVHDRCMKTKEELKRLENRMQKYGRDLSLDALKAGGNEGYSIDNGISDGEPNEGYHKSSRTDEIPKRKRGDKQPDMILRSEKPSAVEGSLQKLESISKASESIKTMVNKGQPSADEFRHRSGFAYTASWDKSKSSENDQSLCSTSVAANALDELTDDIEINEKSEAMEASKARETKGLENGTKIAFILPPPPPLVSQEAYKQYEGDDEEVDVEKMDDEMLDIDINGEVEIEQP